MTGFDHVEKVPVLSLSTKERLLQNSEFLVMLAHEIRNPLSPILNSLRLIEQSAAAHPDDVLLSNAYRVLKRQVHHIESVMDNLLDVTRMVEGKLDIHTEEVDVTTVINRAVENVRSLIDARRHQLNVYLPDETIWLNADAARMQQVIYSLIANAVKFTETKGKINITVNQADDRVVITVKDNGIGVQPEALPHIFELFTQADHAKHIAQGGGLGIGLTLVRAVVQMHGGEVEAHSEGIGKGCEFIVSLPVLRIGGEAPDFTHKEEEDISHRNLEVLIVDDHIDTAESTAIVLRLKGHRTHIAHSGAKALELARIYSPDAVLLDIGLPGMDGYQVARLLKKETPDVHLVAITGYGQEADKRRSRAAGFDLHLVKPVTTEELLEALTMKGEVAQV